MWLEPLDDRPIIEIMRSAGSPGMAYVAAHDDPALALDLMASADLVVAERLHGAVLAAAAGTVPVMLEYRPKLRDFAESIGLGDLVLRTDRLQGGALKELIDTALNSSGELGAVMSGCVEVYRARQAEMAQSVKTALH